MNKTSLKHLKKARILLMEYITLNPDISKVETALTLINETIKFEDHPTKP